MNTAIPQAIAEGGRKLDCYGEALVRIYARSGFEPVARVTFDPNQANPGWKDGMEQSDIYMMMVTDTDPDVVRQKQGSYHYWTDAELAALPLMEYGEAMAYRDKLLAERGIFPQDSGKTGPGTGETGPETGSGQTAARSDRAAAEPTRSDAAQGGGIGQRDYPGITNREKTAILSYKSSESYKINIILRDSGVDALPPNLRSIVDGLDSALPKLPKAEGTLYRTLCFDDLSDPKGALDAFLAEHEVGNTIIYPAYTSTSIRPDGHPLSGDTRYGVVMEINGESAHLLAFGNNFEKEALFPRNTRFCITKVEKKTDGLYHIYMEEAKAHGKADTGGERTARRTGAGLPRGAGERGLAEERRENVQQVQEAHTLYGGLHGVFGMDPG